MLRHILWVNQHAAWVGGCEQYIANTVSELEKRGVRSTLLYDPNCSPDLDYLAVFDAAFPIVDLPEQIESISPDIVYVHQLWGQDQVAPLSRIRQPIIRFYHDHKLFCLRQHKITTLAKKPCHQAVGLQCYPCLGFINRSSNRWGFRIRTLGSLFAEQRLDQELDAFVVGSHYMQGQLLSHGYDSNKIKVIPLFPADCRASETKERQGNIILFVGQLLPGKGLDLLIEALKKLNSTCQLVVAGTGPYEEQYRNLVNELGLNAQVTWLGKVGQERLQELYQQASCVVFPVRAPESFGMVGPEAMRWGTPVIAPDLGGVSEWLKDEETGLFFDETKLESLPKALDRLFSEDGLWERLSVHARQTYEAFFTPEKHVEQLMGLCESLGQKRKQSKVGPWGRLTAHGSDALEQELSKKLDQLAKEVEKLTPPDKLRSLVLIGGYGKGEGGVKLKGGQEMAHNNVDLLVITRGLKEQEDLREQLSKLSKSLGPEWGIGIDFSVIDHNRLRFGAPLLMWYEMAAGGSKVLRGDTAFVRTLSFKEISCIPETDMIKLMVNRGTLLLINRWIADRVEDVQAYREIFLKHIMKAIIGFGDALLYFLGDYHWSYQKKCRRFQRRWDISASLKSLYLEATNYRLKPDSSAYAGKDLVAWTEQLLGQMEDIYLRCESIRLGEMRLNTHNCLDYSLQAKCWEGALQWRSWVKKALALSKPPSSPVGSTHLSIAGFYSTVPSERLAACFPVVAFGIGEEALKRQIANYLGASSLEQRDLRHAYLRHWGELADGNFQAFLQQNALDFQELS